MNRKEYLLQLKEEGSEPIEFEHNGSDVRIFRNSKQRWCGEIKLPTEYLLAINQNGSVDIDFYQPKDSKAKITQITEGKEYPYRISVWFDTSCVTACCVDSFNIPHLNETSNDENLNTSHEYYTKDMCCEMAKEYIDKLNN